MTVALATSGLVKNFGSTRALDGLELTVKTGEVHGFLGRNGTGKSTTIRVLLGLLSQELGLAKVDVVSHPPAEPFYRAIGAVPVGHVAPKGRTTWSRPLLVLEP